MLVLLQAIAIKMSILYIDNLHFEQMVDRIYPAELQLNIANSADTEAPYLDLIYLFIHI